MVKKRKTSVRKHPRKTKKGKTIVRKHRRKCPNSKIRSKGKGKGLGIGKKKGPVFSDDITVKGFFKGLGKSIGDDIRVIERRINRDSGYRNLGAFSFEDVDDERKKQQRELEEEIDRLKSKNAAKINELEQQVLAEKDAELKKELIQKINRFEGLDKADEKKLMKTESELKKLQSPEGVRKFLERERKEIRSKFSKLDFDKKKGVLHPSLADKHEELGEDLEKVTEAIKKLDLMEHDIEIGMDFFTGKPKAKEEDEEEKEEITDKQKALLTGLDILRGEEEKKKGKPPLTLKETLEQAKKLGEKAFQETAKIRIVEPEEEDVSLKEYKEVEVKEYDPKLDKFVKRKKFVELTPEEKKRLHEDEDDDDDDNGKNRSAGVGVSRSQITKVKSFLKTPHGKESFLKALREEKDSPFTPEERATLMSFAGRRLSKKERDTLLTRSSGSDNSKFDDEFPFHPKGTKEQNEIFESLRRYKNPKGSGNFKKLTKEQQEFFEEYEA